MRDLLAVETGHLHDATEGPRPSPDQPYYLERFARFSDDLGSGRLPISSPLFDKATLQQAQVLAREIRSKYDAVVIIGIGGSTLGFRCVLNAIRGPFYNISPGPDPRIFVIDNVDPMIANSVLELVEPAKTLIIYISKSGSTPEPAANFLVFLDVFLKNGGSRRDTVVICDTADNGINEIATRLGSHKFDIPKPLPGRFSVLSAVGVLPSLVAGIPAGEMLDGARSVHEQVVGLQAASNPCFLLGSLLHSNLRKDRNIHFLFSYSNLLAEFNLWFNQLWSESLGKKWNIHDELVRRGVTPVVGVGATDQHSVLQLLKEGPLDKVVGFIRVENFLRSLEIPHMFDDLVEYSYFGGHTINEQMSIEQISTEISLFKEGVPCYSIALSGLSPVTIGALLYYMQLLVVYYAYLEEVNPFDQPGVEEGKSMTYSLMGRGDHGGTAERDRALVEQYRGSSEYSSLEL